MILQGEVKDAKRSSFSSDFQTLIKHQFSFVFLYELLMSFRNFHPALLLTSLSKVIDKSGDIQSTKSKKKRALQRIDEKLTSYISKFLLPRHTFTRLHSK